MRARGFFVTGTGTSVGKTVVSRALAGALTRNGIRAAAIKPVESGIGNGLSDAAALSRVSHLDLGVPDTPLYGFVSAVSPHLAARTERRRIDKKKILGFLDHWVERADVVIAEGAGGLLVPLSGRLTLADIVVESAFHLIVVAPNVLGSINAALLTIDAARRRSIPIAGVILNGTPSLDFDNAGAIATHGRVRILGEVPTTDASNDSVLAEVATRVIKLDRLILSKKNKKK